MLAVVSKQLEELGFKLWDMKGKSVQYTVASPGCKVTSSIVVTHVNVYSDGIEIECLNGELIDIKYADSVTITDASNGLQTTTVAVNEYCTLSFTLAKD